MDNSTTRSELKSFCEGSNIYGLRYFVISRKPWERLFWISFLTLGLALSAMIVRTSLIDWEVGIEFSMWLSYLNQYEQILLSTAYI